MRIKQQQIITDLQKLNFKVQTEIFSQKKNFNIVTKKISNLLKKFSVVNRTVNLFQHEVTGCNSFWSRYLSAFFACISIIVTFMAYFMLNTKTNDSFIIVGFLLFFANILMGMLLWITYECAVIGYFNSKILQLQTKFTFHLQTSFKLTSNVLMKVKTYIYNLKINIFLLISLNKLNQTVKQLAKLVLNFLTVCKLTQKCLNW